MPLIRLDLLSKERLIELSTQRPGLIKGYEQMVIEALCAKLQQAPSPHNTLLSNASRVSFKSQPRNYTDEKYQKVSGEVKDPNRPASYLLETISSARKKVLSPIAEVTAEEVLLGSDPTSLEQQEAALAQQSPAITR